MRTKSRLGLLLTSALIMAYVGAGCRKSPPAEAEGPHPERNASAPNSVRLTEEAVRTGGIAVEPARLVETVHSISGVGELEFNSRRLVNLTARAAGRIESLAAFRGERVVAGQALAEIFSRDYLAFQADILQAAERAARLRGTPDEQSALAFLDAARAKLLPLGVTEEEIDALISTKALRPFLTVRAPFGGRIIEQAAVAGDGVEPGASLFRLADLSTLWASIRIYEKDLSAIRTGVEAILRAQAFPGEEFRGRLVLVGAVVDDKTRTVEGRVEVRNPTERLKPGMYIEASILCGEKHRALVIPESALQEFQSRPVVFVHTAPGVYELRLVETGERTGGHVEILRGLAEG
ncbi:MAG: efflux RND transporter periplasmic adaptor subunit, partial [Acidobacteriota bacterium]